MLTLSIAIRLPDIADKLFIWQNDALLVQPEDELYLVDPLKGTVSSFGKLAPGIEIIATQNTTLTAFDNAGHLLVLAPSPQQSGTFNETRRVPIGEETEIV